MYTQCFLKNRILINPSEMILFAKHRFIAFYILPGCPISWMTQKAMRRDGRDLKQIQERRLVGGEIK